MLRNKQPRLFLNKDVAVGGPILPGVVNISQKEIFYSYAYVWNKTDDNCSEFGTIGIRSFGGGIKRVM